MNYDIRRLLVVIFFSLVLGLFSGEYAVSLCIGFGAFIIWQYRQFNQVLIWLKKRNQSFGPQQSGIIDEICREVESIRDRHLVREQKLEGFLKRFQKATGALPDGVVVLDINGEINWANKKAEDYLGVLWPKDSGTRITNLIRRKELINYLSISDHAQQAGLEMISPVNSQLYLELRVSAYGDEQKLLVARDISQIVKTNRMRKDFIANASHELRTPLTVISGYLESFSDDELCPVEWLAYIRQMRSQASRMQSLIEDLLALSGLEANRKKAEMEIVHVPNMLTSIIKEAITLSGMSQHLINTVIDEKLYLLGHHAQLYSAFSNIVFNAIRYTPDRSEINIQWYFNEEGVYFTVSDNGQGFEREHIPRLTERFYRIDTGRSRERGGTGLGLAIVKHVLVRHNAELYIHSEPGKGSRFTCYFPLSRMYSSVEEAQQG